MPGTSPAFSHGLRAAKAAVRSRHGVVASQNRAASEAGARVLEAGGNAVDAAVATALALHVVEPWMSGLAGGGALVFRAAGGEVRVVDFPMISPAALDPADYPVLGGADLDLFGWPRVEGDRNLLGATAVAVPGVVDGLATALDRFGTRGWADMAAPAIALAERGLPVDWYASLMIASAYRDLSRFPGSAALFLPGGAPPIAVVPSPAGIARLPLDGMAETLRRLAREGPRSFYEGAVAEDVVRDLREAGGCLSADDLRRYRARVVDPAVAEHRGARLYAAPVLNGGPTVMDALAALDPARPLGPEPDAHDHVALASALQGAWRRRFAEMGDAGGESCTTHLGVIDAAGNAVALTQTLLSLFGSRMVLPTTGIPTNNGIMWFDPEPGRPNSLAPGKRPLSNYAPLILERGDDVYALGGAGGRRIIPAMAQLVSFLAGHGMDLHGAVGQPRIDVSGGAWITADRRLPRPALEALAARFDMVEADATAFPFTFATVNGVGREGGTQVGATDPNNPWSEAVAARQ
ncbi:gamma-glutamyltransferase family protein [Arenibaculum sp.]|uniref:gamma-glutamyltransferase family protein n=1 Tax=Arenibaculum sp. TaxID=2865862 RepID=UPI002E0EE84C|nr:gamma-glutamyltransferase [Arenibaculum sp.]